jgi:hypothetical protein
MSFLTSLVQVFFPHGLITPWFTVPAGGGSEAATAGHVATSGPPATSSVIVGDAASLSASVVSFNVGLFTKEHYGSLDIFSHESLQLICAGRQSALLTGPLTVMVTIVPADATSPSTLLSGWCAVMPRAMTGQAYPTSLNKVACLPGARAISVSPMVANSVQLSIPPGIRTDVIIPQVIGRDPVLVFSFSKTNVASIMIVVSGQVALSGIGYWGGFF